MSRSLKVLLSIAALILFVLLIYNSLEIIQAAKHKQKVQHEVFSALSSKGKIDNISDSLISWIAKEILSVEKDSTNLNQKILSIKHSQTKVNFLSLDFVIVASFLLVLSFWIRRRLNDLAIGMLVISTACLWIGLTIPILTIESSQVLPVLGKTIFQYESRGILGSIKTLFSNGNAFLAYLLLLFSVILPFAKTLSLIVISLLRQSEYTKKISLVFSHLGKWSMTDVFVVAILVVFFASSNNASTKSQIETGLYFFIAYVIFSLISSIIINMFSSKLTASS